MLIASQHLAANQDSYSLALSDDGEALRLPQMALYLHVTAWAFEFYGHGVHEGRAPALCTNLFYSLLAPFFVTFEFMNGAFGYRENEMVDIRKKIEVDIAQFREARQHLNCSKQS